MHELRKDPLLNKWVAVLKDSKGPEFYIEDTRRDAAHCADGNEDCVFCQGREHETAEEVFAIRGSNAPANSPGWLTRVIPSKDPIFQVEGDLGRKAVGMYDKMNSIGANEIIIESPLHNEHAEEMGIEQMVRVIKTYRNRLSDLERDFRFRYILICKDFGKAAGEIHSHPHSHVVATPVIPKGIKDELDGAKAYYHYKERCIFCDIIDDEIRTGARIIMDTAHFVAFTPFAPKLPFEYWILPKRHLCAFQEMYNEEEEDLGLVLMITLKKMKRLLKNPPYSFVLHTAPNRVPRRDHWHTLGDDFHCHIEVMPLLAPTSGFERSADFFILATSPENAAYYLKGASPL